MAGRPKLHRNQADKQFAYRQRKRAQHADELAAWELVCGIARAEGLVFDDDSTIEQARFIADYIEATFADYIENLPGKDNDEAMQSTPSQMLRIEDTRMDGGTQSRNFMASSLINKMRKHLQNGGSFLPVVVFYDGAEYWMADGFHRAVAAEQEGIETITADVHKGTKRDAILYSVGTNDPNGLPHNPADKRNAVQMLLDDEEWRQQSNDWIAEQCGVDKKVVLKARNPKPVKVYPKCIS